MLRNKELRKISARPRVRRQTAKLLKKFVRGSLNIFMGRTFCVFDMKIYEPSFIHLRSDFLDSSSIVSKGKRRRPPVGLGRASSMAKEPDSVRFPKLPGKRRIGEGMSNLLLEHYFWMKIWT